MAELLVEREFYIFSSERLPSLFKDVYWPEKQRVEGIYAIKDNDIRLKEMLKEIVKYIESFLMYYYPIDSPNTYTRRELKL
jgi:hypothetical protein